MSAWTHPFLDWLGDYYILATALLLVTLLAGSLIRQPAKRYYVTAGAIIGLAILAVLCASPLWPRLVFIGRSASTIAGGPAEVSATPIVEPLAGRMPVVSGPPLVGSAKPQAERILRPNRRVNSQETGDIQNRTSARIDFPALVAAIFILGASIVSIWLAIGALRSPSLPSGTTRTGFRSARAKEYLPLPRGEGRGEGAPDSPSIYQPPDRHRRRLRPAASNHSAAGQHARRNCLFARSW